jgi:dihydropteroate synthase
MIVKGKGGIRRWLVIVDPGIGFSKTLDGNLEVLRDAAAITANVQIGHGKRYRFHLRSLPYVDLCRISEKAQRVGGVSTAHWPIKKIVPWNYT